MSLRHTLQLTWVDNIQASIDARSPQATAGAPDPNRANYTPTELQLAHASLAAHRKAMRDYRAEDNFHGAGTYDREIAFIHAVRRSHAKPEQAGPSGTARKRKQRSSNADLDTIDRMLLGEETPEPRSGENDSDSTDSQATIALPSGFARPEDLKSSSSLSDPPSDSTSSTTEIIVAPASPPTSPFAFGGQTVHPARPRPRLGGWWSSEEAEQLVGNDTEGLHDAWRSHVGIGAVERERMRVLEEFEEEMGEEDGGVEGGVEGDEEEDLKWALEEPIEGVPDPEKGDEAYGSRKRGPRGGEVRTSPRGKGKKA